MGVGPTICLSLHTVCRYVTLHYAPLTCSLDHSIIGSSNSVLLFTSLTSPASRVVITFYSPSRYRTNSSARTWL